MTRRSIASLLLVSLLTGCGAAPTSTMSFTQVARTAKAASAIKASTIRVPAAFAGTGAIEMAFQFPEARGYSVQAAGASVEKLVVTLKTRSFLLEKVVATTTVTRAQMKNGAASVKFDALKAAAYTVEVEALDAAGRSLGKAAGAATVAEGKVSPVAIDLALAGTAPVATPAPATGGIAITVRIGEDGGVPTPAPTATPWTLPSAFPTVPPTTAPSGTWNTNATVLRTGAFKGCLFGATTQSGLETADSTAAKLGRQLDVNHSFYSFDSAVPSAEDKADVAAGRVPFISFNSHLKSGPDVKWADVASGKQDARLREVARGLKALGKPVFFTYNHEPENDEQRGTPAEYRAAWKRVSDVFKAEGATNVVKVLVIMGWQPSDDWYPGDDVVDWVAGDPYNWAYTHGKPTAKWTAFKQAANAFYTWAKPHHKPMMIAETGCIEDPTQPGRKAQWITEMGEALKAMPEFKALCYFNDNHTTNGATNGWYIDSAPARAAFKALGQDAYFLKH